MTEKGSAIRVDHSAHGIERQKPLIVPMHQAHGIDDRGDKHPDLDQKRDRVSNVSILDIESRKPQPDPHSTKESEGNEKWKKKNTQTWENLVPDHEGCQNKQSDEEVEQPGKGSRSRHNNARKVHLCDEVRTSHQAVSGGGHSIRKISPGQKTCVNENRVGESIRRHFCKPSKKQGEYEHGKGRLNDRPKASKNGLLVPHLYVPLSQEIEKFTVVPDLSEVHRDPASFRFNDRYGRSGFAHIKWCL